MFNFAKIKEHQANILDHHNHHKSAVIVPIVEKKGEKYLLFEVRSHNLNSQPGEICFPGGGMEPVDKTPLDTAIRETCEELGLSRNNLKTIGALDILLTPFQAMIYPFVAEIKNYGEISPNKNEVQEIFYVPLTYFLNNTPETYLTKVLITPQEDFPKHYLPNGKTYNWKKGSYPVHFYPYEDRIIWGITARIINHFVQLIKEV